MNYDSEKYYVDENNQLIDISTGEVVDKDKIKQAYENKLIEQRNEYNEELIKMGIDFNMLFVKYRGVEYPVVTIKKNFAFRKVFTVSVRKLIKDGNLSKNAKIFIATFESYIYFPYNSIVVDNKNPDIDTMCSMLELKKSAVYDAIKELEDKEVIKKVKMNGDMIIYFNPFLYCSGGVIHKDTYKMFEYSIYNMERD